MQELIEHYHRVAVILDFYEEKHLTEEEFIHAVSLRQQFQECAELIQHHAQVEMMPEEDLVDILERYYATVH